VEGFGGGANGKEGKRRKADLPRVNEFMDHISYEKGHTYLTLTAAQFILS
jgi:hypothetical protein